jgi:hypothetical protein
MFLEGAEIEPEDTDDAHYASDFQPETEKQQNTDGIAALNGGGTLPTRTAPKKIMSASS